MRCITIGMKAPERDQFANARIKETLRQFRKLLCFEQQAGHFAGDVYPLTGSQGIVQLSQF